MHTSLLLVASLLVLSGKVSLFQNAYAQDPNGVAVPSATSSNLGPEGTASVTPTASPKAAVKLSAEKKKKLLIEFRRALSDEEKALDHQERASTRELNAAQGAALKAWRLKEKLDRRAYFEKHESGPERRECVQEYLARKKAFDQSQKDDQVAAKRNWKDKRDLLKSSQKERDAQFKLELDQNHIPSTALWPQGH